jgi:hypothetical protein
MKFLIATLAALTLAVGIGAGSAAAYDYYWAKAGRSYSCQGEPGGLICKSKAGRRYQVLLDGKGVGIYNSSGHVQFTCRYSCTDFRY